MIVFVVCCSRSNLIISSREGIKVITYFLIFEIKKFFLPVLWNDEMGVLPFLSDILECSVFPIQSLDVCSKTRLIRKTTCETQRGANATGEVRAFSVTQASV